MTENQKVLGSTPENHQERGPLVCPSCERDFKEIGDYPKVLIASVSVIKPDDVPAELPHWYQAPVFEKPKAGRKQELVPAEVLEYFRANPDKNKLVHSDSYIYLKDFNEGEYERQLNYAPTIRAMIEQNTPLREYMEFLQQMTGQEVSTREILPQWERDDYFPSYFQVPSEHDVPYSGRFLLRLREDEQGATEYRVAKVGIWVQDLNVGRAGGPRIRELLPIGSLNYEGRVLHT